MGIRTHQKKREIEEIQMDGQEKIQTIQLFSKRYGLTSLTHPPEYQFPNYSYCTNERRVRWKPSSCLLDSLPESILHEILSRLSIPDLLMARQSCIAWHCIISSCRIFQELYETNHQSWIAFTSSSRHNPDGFLLFNSKNADHCYSLSLPQHPAPPITAGWFLQGVAEGLMLVANRKGRLAVANPLTRRLRLLPDAKISSHLCLASCLKKKLWQHDLPSISINIVAESELQTFKVMVLGEMRMKEVHALIYNSLTDTWTIKRCSDINYKLFRRFFHSTVHGNTIYCASIYPLTINCTSIYPKWMVSYNTETQLCVAEEIPLIDMSEIGSTSFRRVQTIGIVGYKGRIFLLGVVVGKHKLLLSRPFTVVGVWETNPGARQWKLWTTTPLEWVSTYSLDFRSYEMASAYDGEQRVSIIARNGWSRTITLELNLETKEWKMLSAGIAENKNSSSITSGSATYRRRDKGVKAFHMKLKFRTAI